MKSRSSSPPTPSTARAPISNPRPVGLCLSLLLVTACAPTLRPPSPISVSPAWGNTRSQTFSVTWSAPIGFSDLTDLRVLFASSTDGRDACYLRYDPVRDTIGLVDDDSVNWTDISLRRPGSIENNQCRVTAQGSSATGNGTRLTLKLALTFKRVFAGHQNIYLYAKERQGLEAGFTKKGMWSVPYWETE